MNGLYCFTGYPGSGKSAACDIAADAGCAVTSMGDIVRARARDDLGDDATSDEIGEWATAQREAHGDTVIAEYTADAIEQMDEETVIVDGVRSLDEMEVFRDRFDETTLVYIQAPFEERLARIQDRGREDEGDASAADLRERDHREEQWGLAELIEQERYDTVIENTGTLDELRAEVHKVLGTARGRVK